MRPTRRVALPFVLLAAFACRAPEPGGPDDRISTTERSTAEDAAVTSSTIEVSDAASPESPAAAEASSQEPYPLSPEMAQLEADLATEEYRATILSWRNHNDLNGEMNRADLPGNARRFAAEHGGVDAVEADPELARAHARRVVIEEAFLALMKEAYTGLNRAPLFDEELARIAREAAETAETAAELPPPVAIAPILPAPDAAAHWPRWRGPGGQGLSDETGLATEWGPDRNVAWKVAIPGRGNSSPVIWGDRIWLTTAFEEEGRRALVCVQRSDGTILWTREAPTASLEKKFIDKNSWASPTPVVDGERVVAFLGNAGIVGWSLDGEQLWHYPMPWFDGSHGTGASPQVCGDLVVLVQEHNRGASIAVGVDKRTGEERWKRELDTALGWCTVQPLRVGGRDELVFGLQRRLVGVAPETGAELWTCDGPTREVVPTVVYGQGLVYSCSGRNGPTIAVRPGGDGDVTATHVAWSIVRGAPHVPSPILIDGLIYFTNDNGILTCLDATQGDTVYQNRLKGKFTASPVAADGKIWFTNEVGDTFVVRQGREFEILAVNSFGETTLASAAILDGRLYYRTEGHLWAIEEEGESR